MSSIIVTAADANYFELVQGTILSIREQPQGNTVAVGFFDLGCTVEQLDWLKHRVDLIREPDWNFGFPDRQTTPQHFKGLLARPFLPQYFPGFDVYLWLDADAWVQNWSAIELLLRGATRRGMAIVPELDRCSPHLYGNWAQVQEYAFQHYCAVFGEEIAQHLRSYPVLNAGVFAIHRDAPHWAVWASCLQQGLQRHASIITDQVALNLAIYGYRLLEQTEILPAWCNWTRHCCGLPAWDAHAQRLVEPYLPNTPIGIFHLTVEKAERAIVKTLEGEEVEISLRYCPQQPDIERPLTPPKANLAPDLPATQANSQAAVRLAELRAELRLREINLICFPNWNQSESVLLSELAATLKTVLAHPDRNRMTILVAGADISPEVADLTLASVVMQLLYEENLDGADAPEISLIGSFSQQDWELLHPYLKGRLRLESENYPPGAKAKLESLPIFEPAGLSLQPDSSEFWYQSGMALYQAGEYENALPAFAKALELDPARAAYHYSWGLLQEQREDITVAAQAYQQAIALEPMFIDAYTNLGNLVAEHGDPQQAERIYQQAIAHHPGHLGSYLNRGNVLLIQGKVEQAIADYKTGLTIEPDHTDLLNNLTVAQELAQDEVKRHLFAGDHLYSRRRYQMAASHYQTLLDRQQLPEAGYLALADCYEKLKQYDAVLQVCQQAIALYPSVSLYTQSVRVLQETGRTAAAIAEATQAATRFPDEILFRLQKKLLLPVLYQTQAEISLYQQRFTQGLQALPGEIALDKPGAPENALAAINQFNNFFLICQNANHRRSQQAYGELIHRVMAANFPQWVQPMPMLPKSHRIRVGYVSGCLWEHTVGKLMSGWFQHHDRDRFQIHTYHISDTVDALTQAVQQHSDQFHKLPPDLNVIAPQIRGDQLHVLVFLELGMQPILSQLAALRLAPVQCTTWAHPITTGLPTVDYFLSSDLMEPEAASEHYSEQLIRLPNLAVSYAEPRIPPPPKPRSAFQLRDDAIVYLACQTLIKYLPEQDAVFATIAQRVPQAQFVFLTRPNAPVAQQFQQRLQEAFAQVGLDSKTYCVMLPQLSQADYWNLNQIADVFLDSFHWSGGHTTLEAIACQLPVVTLPGEFMRGRHSLAILTMLSVTDTIAPSEADYIEIAVRLGCDRSWRQSLIQRMMDGYPRLYGDKTCVTALEEFYQQVVRH